MKQCVLLPIGRVVHRNHLVSIGNHPFVGKAASQPDEPFCLPLDRCSALAGYDETVSGLGTVSNDELDILLAQPPLAHSDTGMFRYLNGVNSISPANREFLG